MLIMQLAPAIHHLELCAVISYFVMTVSEFSMLGKAGWRWSVLELSLIVSVASFQSIP